MPIGDPCCAWEKSDHIFFIFFYSPFRLTRGLCYNFLRKRAGVAQLVEHLPSKQNVASSSLVSRSAFFNRFKTLNRRVENADVA